MKPTRKVAITNVNAVAKAQGSVGQGSKPVRNPATKADARKAEYVRKPVRKSGK